MKGAGFPILWCLSTIPLVILLIFFTILLSVPNKHLHHELLFSTYDLLVVAKSSREAVFVMFNVIIITVIIGSLRPSNYHKQASTDHLYFTSTHPAPEYDILDHTKDIAESDGSDIEDLDGYYDHGYGGYEEENDDDLDTEDLESEEEDNYELERRIEEFIAKVTGKWREELLTDHRLLCITAS